MPYFIALLALDVAAVQASPDSRLVLWHTLRAGMSGEETVAAIQAIDGVKKASLNNSKSETKISITYVYSGIEVGVLTYKIDAGFEGNRLVSVHLTSDACLSLSFEKLKGLRDLLGQKYGPYRTQKEVTEDGQLIAGRDTYAKTPTRVIVRLVPGELPQYVHGGTGLAGSLAKLSNIATDQAIASCPNDQGRRATIEITYADNEAAAKAEADESAVRKAKQASDKAKL